jgi:hypothetical protein
MEHGEIQLAASRGQQAAKKTRHYGLSTRHFGNFGLRILIFILKFQFRNSNPMLYAISKTGPP